MKIALQSAFTARFYDLPHLEIQLKPKKGVFVGGTQKLKANAIMLIPVTTNVSIITLQMQRGTASVSLGIVGQHPKTLMDLIGVASPPRMVLNVPQQVDGKLRVVGQKTIASDSPYMIPYWIVDSTTDADMANIEHSEIKVAVKTEVGNQPGGSIDQTITIPVMRNTKALLPGRELLIFSKSQKRTAEAYVAPPTDVATPKQSDAVTAKRARGRGGRGRGS